MEARERAHLPKSRYMTEFNGGDDPNKVIDIKRRKKQSASELNWKIAYKITKSDKSEKKRPTKEQFFFWLKFIAYLGLVAYLLQQCGYLSSLQNP